MCSDYIAVFPIASEILFTVARYQYLIIYSREVHMSIKLILAPTSMHSVH